MVKCYWNLQIFVYFSIFELEESVLNYENMDLASIFCGFNFGHGCLFDLFCIVTVLMIVCGCS